MIPTDKDKVEITKELAGDTLLMFQEMAIEKVKMLMMMIKKISKENLSQNIMTVQAFIADLMQKMILAAKKMETKIPRAMIQSKEKYFHLEFSLRIYT